MATVPQEQVTVVLPAQPKLASRATAAAEALLVFAACQLFLWKYSRQYHRGWLFILAFMILSIVLRRGAQPLGLTLAGARGAARWMAIALVVGCVPSLIFGAVTGQVKLVLPDAFAFAQFGGYLLWCVLQQFALQSYMHNRLLEAIPNPHVTSSIVGLMFASLHIPNPTLMIVTFVGGIAMGEVFARYRNIWVLALAQALIATCILVGLPDAWHHRLRVGPGYHWWEVGK